MRQEMPFWQAPPMPSRRLAILKKLDPQFETEYLVGRVGSCPSTKSATGRKAAAPKSSALDVFL